MATPEEQARARDEQQRRAAAAAVAAGTLVVVGDPAAPAEGVPTLAARAAAAGTILSSLVAYLAVQRARMRGWLVEQMRRRQPSASQNDIENVVAEEERRQAEFERKQAERFSRDLTTALAIPDAAAREGAIRGLTKREQRYARQREIAMAARAFAAIDRTVLRGQSPMGAFWKLDPTVIEHTAGCLIMGGKFWPWAVLDRVHPPRHAGCPCRLIGYGEAIADGLMAPGAVRDVQTAIRAAASVVMEGVQLDLDPEDARALVEMGRLAEEQQLRQALVEQGLTSPEALDELAEDFNPAQPRDPGGEAGGQWTKHPFGAAAKKAGAGVGRLLSGTQQGVATDILNSLKAWKGGDLGPDAPSDEQIVKNWKKAFRGRLSKDAAAKKKVESALHENDSNPQWRALQENFAPDQVVVTTKPEPGTYSLIDHGELSSAHRGAPGTTILWDSNVPFIELDAKHGKYGPGQSGSTRFGLAAVLRHEYGHSVADALGAAKVKQIVEGVKDPETNVTKYSGKNASELFCELMAIRFDPRWKADDWEPSVVAAADRMLVALGLSKVKEEELEEAFDVNQPRWPKGHAKAGQWRPKVSSAGGRASQGWFDRDIGELKTMAAPRKIGTSQTGDGPEEELFERSKPQHEVEAIGKKVAQLAERYSTVGAYQQRIDDLAAERNAIADKFWERAGGMDGYRKLWKELDEQGIVDPTAELDQRLYTEAERARQKAMNEEVVRLSRAKDVARRDALVGILAQIRPMGGQPNVQTIEVEEGMPQSVTEAAREFIASFREVGRLIPTAWWEDVNARGAITFRASTKRAWHLSDKKELGLHGSTIRVNPNEPGTLLHELAHRFESHYGEPNNAGYLPLLGPTVKFRQGRKKPGEATVKLNELRPNSSYEDHERTYEDEFADPYMGKVYLADRSTEILTMGMERIFYPAYGSSGSIDDEMRDFILGLMATV